uniref:Isocitrate lyase n=1 Tax=Prasinoderma singulare TaxID=676789 RepID=A0A7S3BDH9_9VIRI
MLVEDQAWPKSCGHVGAKTVVPRDEAVRRVRAACDARDALGLEGVAPMDRPMVFARSDARQAEGLEEALARAEAFAAAGFSAPPPLVVAQQQRRFTAAGLDALCDGLMAHQLKQRQRGEAEFEEEKALGDGGTSYRMVQEVLLVQRGT